MGGRGTPSSYGTSFYTGRPLAFYDRTDKFKDMSKHQFENAIRDRKTEYIGIFDKNDKLLIAGTSGSKNSVAIPVNEKNFDKMYTLTHNHPYSGNRIIGGTFSEADVFNHAFHKIKGESRAVSNGPNENTYIIRSKKGITPNYQKLQNYALTIKNSNKMNAVGKSAVNRVYRKANKKGKAAPRDKENQIYLGSLKKIWKNKKVSSAGFEYIEVKKAHW